MEFLVGVNEIDRDIIYCCGMCKVLLMGLYTVGQARIWLLNKEIWRRHIRYFGLRGLVKYPKSNVLHLFFNRVY